EIVDGVASADKVGEANVVNPIVPTIAKAIKFFLIIDVNSSKYYIRFCFFILVLKFCLILVYTFKNLLIDNPEPSAPIPIPRLASNKINCVINGAGCKSEKYVPWKNPDKALKIES